MKKATDFIHQEKTLPAGERHNQIRLTLPNGKVISIVQGDSTQRAHGVHGEATYTTHLDRMWTGNTFEDCAKVERAWIYSCSRVDTWHTLAYGLARPIGDWSVWWHKKEL